jgi:hypothetical protein
MPSRSSSAKSRQWDRPQISPSWGGREIQRHFPGRCLDDIDSTNAPHRWVRPINESPIIGNPEEVDDDLTCCRASGIPSEACLPRETGMRSLRTGKNHIRWDGPLRRRRRQVHLNSLISHEMLTGTSMFSAAPILPEERCGTNCERMEQDAHLAWLLGGTALPLALLAQGTRPTTANAGRIHHTQAPTTFSTPLMGNQRPPGWTPEGAERLGEESLSQ